MSAAPPAEASSTKQADPPVKPKAAKPKSTPAKIAVSQIAVVPINTLTPYRKNPRKGNVEAVAESLKVNGQYRPLVVNKGEKASVRDEVLAGNHTLMAAKKLRWTKIAVTYVDVTDDEAKKIVLADNRTNDLSGYDPTILADLLKQVPDPVGTGYTSVDVQGILAGIEERNVELITEVVAPRHVDFGESKLPDEDELDADRQRRYDENIGNRIRAGAVDPLAEIESEELAANRHIADLQHDLEGCADIVFPSENYWGIPELKPDMLIDSIPDPIATWGGPDASEDDGVTTWLWNFGLASSKGLPWDRTIMCAFTYDSKFQSLYDDPAWQFARLIHNGLKYSIVPDFSFWTEEPRFLHLQSAYRAQWLGRFMQSLGIRVMPRLMWCDPESIKYGRLGVPINAPVVAVCFQAASKQEFKKGLTAEGLRQFVREVKPQSLLVYGGNPAKEVVADAHLPKELHVQHVDNYAAVRRGVVFDKQEGAANKDVKRAAKAKHDTESEAGEDLEAAS